MSPLQLPDEPIGYLDAEEWSALGASPLVIIDLQREDAAEVARRLADRSQAVIIGVDHPGVCPATDETAFDCLLTTKAGAPRPWVSIQPGRMNAALQGIKTNVARAPVAAAALARVLRVNEQLGLRDALAVESFAYSTLLSGAAFRQWRAQSPAVPPAVEGQGAPVAVARDGDHVTLTLASSETRNAMRAAMRDALFEALAAVLDDPTRPSLTLMGAGRCFSVGGELAEFGTATDLAMAHAVRTVRSCALLLAELGNRVQVRLHGACIGSGIEIPAAAASRIAEPGTFFQLPELTMGLIPGAGGTVSILRAIGRHRTAWMVLSARRVAAADALHWGLVNEIVSP